MADSFAESYHSLVARISGNLNQITPELSSVLTLDAVCNCQSAFGGLVIKEIYGSARVTFVHETETQIISNVIANVVGHEGLEWEFSEQVLLADEFVATGKQLLRAFRQIDDIQSSQSIDQIRNVDHGLFCQSV